MNVDFNKLIDKNNDTIEKIFDLVKQRNWKDLVKLIKTTEIDLNIKDNSGTWLLEYVVLFNQIELVVILLDKNVRIDITDDDSKSILYGVIKFSYTDILVKFLEKNENSIGKSILELKDSNQNIPLFYAIKLFNIECVKIILNWTKNFYIANSDGDNALHLAIKSQNFELFKLVSDYFNDVRARNKNGESYLHLIIKLKCYTMLEYFVKKISNEPNIKEILNFIELKYNFTILHYICVGLDFVSLNILFKLGVLKLLDGDIQDNSGNIFYHYFINNIINYKNITPELESNILGMNKLFGDFKWNINTYNIDGNTPAHIFFSNINFFSLSNLNILINWVGESTDMNIQNFKGESVFYLLVKNNYWKNLSNILREKKLDVFIIVGDGEIIFNHLEKKDYNDFLDMVTQSYLFQLSDESKFSKWIEYWDNRCKKIVKFSELNETELELIKNLNLNLNTNNNKKFNHDSNICFDVVRNKLDKSIQIFIKSKNIFDSTSYPQTHKFIKLISQYPNVVVSTFSGSTIDVLAGMFYLTSKLNNQNNSIYILTSLNLLKDKNDIIECNPITQSNSNIQSLSKNICEINGFEIIWMNKNIIFPTFKNNSINSILKFLVNKFNHKEQIKQTKKELTNSYRWFVVPIGIEFSSFSHANYLIIDIEKLEIERFEPHGAYPPVGFDYFPELLDMFILNYIEKSGIEFKYFKPKDYLPKIGFQIIEINELNADYIGDPNGFCAIWCIWWCDMRLSNPDIPRKKLAHLLTKELINNKYSYKKLIRDYSYYIVDIRDKLFIKANTNINEWINDTIPHKNMLLLNDAIKEKINEL